MLAKGLNFTVTTNHTPHVEVITAAESANISAPHADKLRTKATSSLVNTKPPLSNLSKTTA